MVLSGSLFLSSEPHTSTSNPQDTRAVTASVIKDYANTSIVIFNTQTQPQKQWGTTDFSMCPLEV